MLKAVIFVDGANLVGSLKKINIKINDYQAFFKHIFEEASNIVTTLSLHNNLTFIMTRAYMYQLGSMDDLDFNNSNLLDYLNKAFEDNPVKNFYMETVGRENPTLSQSEKKERAFASFVEYISKWYKSKKDTLEGIKSFNYSVQSSTDFIEVIECGHWRVDAVNCSVEEKGIDVAFSVDVATKIHQYDIGLLITGDADTIPAISYAKNNGKIIGVVDFIKGSPPESKGRQSSKRLLNVADFVYPIYETTLLSKKIGHR